jgi:hypothetical protein
MSVKVVRPPKHCVRMLGRGPEPGFQLGASESSVLSCVSLPPSKR